MVCRNRAKGEEAQREIKEQSGNEAVDLLIADLSSSKQSGNWFKSSRRMRRVSCILS